MQAKNIGKNGKLRVCSTISSQISHKYLPDYSWTKYKNNNINILKICSNI